MGKTIRIGEGDLKELLKRSFQEVMNESKGDVNLIKVFCTKQEVEFLEDLLERLHPDNQAEDAIIKKIRTSLTDAQVNL